MAFGEQKNLYEILEIAPEATPQEIRAAFIRLKSTYSKDSPALYSLYSKEETESLIHQVGEAYRILSNPEKRREYDLDQEPYVAPKNVISIDRTPPMEMTSNESDILVAQSTDFGLPIDPEPSLPEQAAHSMRAPVPTPLPQVSHRSTSSTAVNTVTPISGANANEIFMEEEIQHEAEWRGSFIKKVREFRMISLDEIADSTKISKRYLAAIEDENYALLPATVFLRGFLIQLAKKLRVPVDRLTSAYLSRYRQACPQKN